MTTLEIPCISGPPPSAACQIAGEGLGQVENTISSNRKIALIRSEILLGCAEAASELGIDLTPIISEHGMDPKVLVSPEGFLPDVQVVRFLQAIADRFDCQHFGFLVGKHQPPLQFGVGAMLLKLAPTLRAALENAVYYHRVYAQNSTYRLVLDADSASFRRHDNRSYDTSARQLSTLGIVQAFKMLKTLGGATWRPIQVAFTHSPPREARTYSRELGCPVLFDQAFDEIIFPAEDLERTIPTADPEMLAIIKAHFNALLSEDRSESNLVDRTREYIQQRIGTSVCNLEGCAQRFLLHPRALQRDLAANNTSFKKLLREVRMKLARQCLQESRLPLSSLAQVLGYRNLSAFSRAFREEHGVPPTRWRLTAHRAGGSESGVRAAALTPDSDPMTHEYCLA